MKAHAKAKHHGPATLRWVDRLLPQSCQSARNRGVCNRCPCHLRARPYLKMHGPISRLFLRRGAKNRVATQRFRHIKQANAPIATCRGRLTNYCAALTKAVYYQFLRWSFSVEKISIHQLHGRQGMPLTTLIWAPPNRSNRYPDKEGVILLSGGNPQVARANRDLPAREYIAAIPRWKRDLGERRDALIAQSVPNMRRAVKWNSRLNDFLPGQVVATNGA